MPPNTLEVPRPNRTVRPQLAEEIRRELAKTDWQGFNDEVQSKVAPLVEAYAEARIRSRERMIHKVLR